MKSAQLNRVLKLVRRTGDHFVIMDNASDEVFVLMNLREYEKKLDGLSDWEDLDEEEMENRVGENFADWKRRQNFSEENFCAGEKLAEAAETTPYEEEFEEDKFKPADLPEDFLSPDVEIKAEPKYIPAKEEEIIAKTVESATVDTYPLGGEEEKLTDITDEENEPKFYLEPIV